jgi:hypothetical protein
MLVLTTPQTVPNITRIKATSFSAKEDYFSVTVQFRPPPGGQDEATQSGRAYSGTHTIDVRNGPDPSDRFAFNTDSAANPYSDILAHDQIAVSSAFDHCVTAISGQSSIAQMLRALETSLSTDGLIPPGTVS